MTLRAKKCLHINGRSSWNDPEQLALKVSEKYRNFYGKNVFLFLSLFVSLYILQNIFISIKIWITNIIIVGCLWNENFNVSSVLNLGRLYNCLFIGFPGLSTLHRSFNVFKQIQSCRKTDTTMVQFMCLSWWPTGL